MQSTRSRMRTKEEGSAFVISILVLFVLTVLGMALMLTTTTEKDIAVNYRWGEQALLQCGRGPRVREEPPRVVTSWRTMTSPPFSRRRVRTCASPMRTRRGVRRFPKLYVTSRRPVAGTISISPIAALPTVQIVCASTSGASSSGTTAPWRNTISVYRPELPAISTEMEPPTWKEPPHCGCGDLWSASRITALPAPICRQVVTIAPFLLPKARHPVRWVREPAVRCPCDDWK